MTNTPDTPSSDYKAMAPYWSMVETILAGAEAMRSSSEYLPKFPNESQGDYDYRLANAKFTNVFADICDDLSERPFAEPVKLNDKASDRIKALADNIDGRGNNLHAFASSTFYRGIAYAVDWILVEFTKAKPRQDGLPLTIAEEAKQGLRPYWVGIPAKNVIAPYSEVIDGIEQFVHVRIKECLTRRSGWDEVTVERVRIMDREPILDADGNTVGFAPATYTVWEKVASSSRRSAKTAWSIVDAGLVTIGVIPLVPYATGRRIDGSWRFRPRLKDAADLQIELFQQETALKSIKEAAAFPMLAGNGVSPATGSDGSALPINVGPKSVLYAPPFGDNGQHGEWDFIEPSSETLRFLAQDVENTTKQLRELGRQPLTFASGNLTVPTTKEAGRKANSAVQAWAILLEDALDQAMVYTSMWLKEPEGQAATVEVFKDFALSADDDQGPDALQKMRENGDLSRGTLWSEFRRRNILSADFDAQAEETAISKEPPPPRKVATPAEDPVAP